MLKASWNSLSLRASLVVSMMLMLVPLAVSAVLGYLILNATVIADYRDVAERQRNQIAPLQALQLDILQAEVPLEEYLVTSEPERLREYRNLRQRIEADFVRLDAGLAGELAVTELVGRAQNDWTSLESVVTELLAAHETRDQAALAAALSRFNSGNDAAHDKLEAAHLLVEEAMAADYRNAAAGFERSEWVAVIAGAVSLVLMTLGIRHFTRTILDSVERLVEGARRFSLGDRSHRIEVQVPPELQKVAEEFNRMINVIHLSEENLAEQARRDKLTGLLNRMSYEEVMKDAFERLKRNGERFALLAADVDHFKRVNDTWGHDAGDDVLRAVAVTMTNSVRSIDKVFRTGGEEFSILLPGADVTAAKATAERLRLAIEEQNIVAGRQQLKVTVSVGLAMAGFGGDTPERVKKQADIALYQAKAAGRNVVVAA